jgi:hypothetical protein
VVVDLINGKDTEFVKAGAVGANPITRVVVSEIDTDVPGVVLPSLITTCVFGVAICNSSVCPTVALESILITGYTHIIDVVATRTFAVNVAVPFAEVNDVDVAPYCASVPSYVALAQSNGVTVSSS